MTKKVLHEKSEKRRVVAFLAFFDRAYKPQSPYCPAEIADKTTA